MPPRLVLCHCDPEWTALAVCAHCERAELHRLLLRRGAVQDNPIVVEAERIVADAERLDRADETDRSMSHLERFWTYGR